MDEMCVFVITQLTQIKNTVRKKKEVQFLHKQLPLSDRQHFPLLSQDHVSFRLPPFNLLKPTRQKINKLTLSFLFYPCYLIYPLCWIMFQLWTTNNVKWWWKLFTLSFWKLLNPCACSPFCFDSKRLCRLSHLFR